MALMALAMPSGDVQASIVPSKRKFDNALILFAKTGSKIHHSHALI
jgi:hypothetical protein